MGSGSSKAAFREALQQLSNQDVPRDDKDFWGQLLRTGTTPQDVFEVVTPTAVRKMNEEHPGNVETLLRVATAHIEKVLATPDPILFSGAMTAVRTLTRILPFILENSFNVETGEVNPDIHRLFWSAESGTETVPGADGESAGEAASAKTLGESLVLATMRLLFARQLTVDVFSSAPQQEETEEERTDPLRIHDASLCWVGGLSAARKASIGHGKDLQSNRVEVMRLMLVLMCEPLFQKNVRFDPSRSRFAQEVCKADAPFASELFFSLLGVISLYDPVGWGLPYGGAFSSELPVKELDMAAQLLVVLLDYGKPPLPVITGGTLDVSDTERGVREDPPAPGGKGYNVFRNLVLHGLKEEEDFKAVFTGLSRLLNNLHQSRNTYIPGSTMTVKCYQEVLVLMWKLMEENPVFMQYVLKHCNINEMLTPICYLLMENRKDASKGGLIHICTFILLKLSGERAFGIAINTPCTTRLPTDLPLFTGSHLDMLILTVHKLLVAGSERLSSLYHCFLTVLCNVSPYCKSMSLVSSVKLLNLFELFTGASNLYASESNQTYVSLLLELFSNIVQYQYGGNAHLVYAIVRRKEIFESLYNLDVDAAVSAAAEYAKSTKAKSGGTRSAGGTSTEVAEPAIGLVAGPEDTGGGVSNSVAVLQQANGPPRARQGTSGAAEPESEQAEAAPVRLRFKPSQEWLDKLRSEVPFNTIMRLLHHLTPQVEALAQSNNSLDEATMVNFVSGTTMVGLLPVPHPIIIRKYHPNQHTAIWFTAFMWGVVFVRNQELPMFDGKMIRLFTVTAS